MREPGHGSGAGARPRSCADFLSNWVCVSTVCAYLVPSRVVAVERTCRAVQSGWGSVWSAQGPVQAQLFVILDSDLLDPHRWPIRHIFSQVLMGMLREQGVREVLMLLSDVVHQGAWLMRLSPGHRWVRAVGGAHSSACRIWAHVGDDGGVSGGHGGSQETRRIWAHLGEAVLLTLGAAPNPPGDADRSSVELVD